jgi:hypothetical protein
VRLPAGAAVGLVMMLALIACGTKASSTATSSNAPSATATSASPTGTATASGATDTDPTTAGTGTGDTATASSQSSAATTGAAGSRGRGRHGHGDHGLPAAPNGLTPTAGYATYERCQGTCTGSVPASLRRPLNLPSADGGPCPITINPHGPLSPRELPAGVGFHGVSGSQWPEAEVTWTAVGGYTGPVLIRGEMLGGGGLGFGTGAVPYDELQLLDAGQGAPRVTGDGRAWITYTRIRSGGCYAYQVDGTGFSEVVVFRAVA